MKWEYQLILEENLKKLRATLDEMGDAGWEAVSFSMGAKVGFTKGEHAVLFKRLKS